MKQQKSLREKKKEKTYETLAKVARTLFLEKGFEETTVEEIARHAEISRRTFFRYFSTKEAVAFPHAQERLQRFSEAMQHDKANKSAFTRVKSAFLTIASEYMQSKHDVLAQAELSSHSPTLQAFEIRLDKEWEVAIARALEEEGRYTARQCRLFAGAFMGIVRTVLHEWARHRGQLDLHELGEEAFLLLEKGLLHKTCSEPLPSSKNTKQRT